MPDTKDFRTIDEQIEGLEKRGLQFKNKKKAVDILKKYNYFDVINGFESILLKRNVGVKEYVTWRRRCWPEVGAVCGNRVGVGRG